MAGAPDSIPDRLQRGERADVVIMAGAGIDELVKAGRVVPGSRVDLARSSIGVAVRAGAPKPDISSVDALTRALLQAKSVAYSSSVSGVYISTELFQRLGIAAQMAAKSRKIESEPVARSSRAARPSWDSSRSASCGRCRVSRWSAAAAGRPARHDLFRRRRRRSPNPTGGRALIAFLASPAARAAIATQRHGSRSRDRLVEP